MADSTTPEPRRGGNRAGAKDAEARLRKRAYEIWEGEGRPPGRDQEHWEQARRELGVDKSPAKPKAAPRPRKKTSQA